MDGHLMRLVLSPKIHDSRVDIETRWSIDDVMETLEWLDLAEDVDTLRGNYEYDMSKARGRGTGAR